jgi:hypothetical protein
MTKLNASVIACNTMYIIPIWFVLEHVLVAFGDSRENEGRREGPGNISKMLVSFIIALCFS